MQPDDIEDAAALAREAMRPITGWEELAAGLEWTRRRTLDHIIDAMAVYAVHLASRATDRLPAFRDGNPTAPVAVLLDLVQPSAAVLAEVARAADPDVRAFHPAGMADASGFCAMAVEEILVHSHDIAGGAVRPPPELCERLLARLFPWAPTDEDPWRTVLWASGRLTLDDHGKLGPDWYWHCAPIDEWDGTINRRETPPTW